jgi:hypothetical protein
MVSLLTVPTVIGDPMEGVITYPVIADPPLLAGVTQVTIAAPFSAVADTSVGASGIVAGVTALEATELGPVLIAFVAETVKV